MKNYIKPELNELTVILNEAMSAFDNWLTENQIDSSLGTTAYEFDSGVML